MRADGERLKREDSFRLPVIHSHALTSLHERALLLNCAGARTVRLCRPLSYLGSLFTQGLPWTVLAVLAPAKSLAVYPLAYLTREAYSFLPSLGQKERCPFRICGEVSCSQQPQ